MLTKQARDTVGEDALEQLHTLHHTNSEPTPLFLMPVSSGATDAHRGPQTRRYA
jgi:hypothetical protein